MAYSTVAEVKAILGITEATWDTEISGCITDADARINNKLSVYTSVPLDPVPQVINVASKNLAASLFRERRDPVGAKAFEETGIVYLQEYIESHFYRGEAR